MKSTVPPNKINLIGHQQQRDNLSALAAKESLAHSNLFVGPRGIGKRLVARELAESLLCEDPHNGKACSSCPACHLLYSGNHPDYYLIECKKDGFTAEQARELLYSINLAPYRGQRRVIILNDADSLSLIVANLLLKTLEEPRKETFFFLIAANASRLPVAVVSRCQMWRFSALSEDEIKTFLAKLKDPSLLNDLFELSNGSLENINDIEDFIPQWQSIKSKLEVIMKGDESAAMTLATELSKDKEELPQRLGLVRLFIRAKLHLEMDGQKKLILADGLDNMISAERLISERNLAPLAVLNLCFLGLSGNMPPQGRLIGEIVV